MAHGPVPQPITVFRVVLISSSCCNKLPQRQWLKTTQMYCLIILEICPSQRQCDALTGYSRNISLALKPHPNHTECGERWFPQGRQRERVHTTPGGTGRQRGNSKWPQQKAQEGSSELLQFCQTHCHVPFGHQPISLSEHVIGKTEGGNTL